MLGRVDDLSELYRSARVVINPVLAGTGLKIKTVEALSRLRPIDLADRSRGAAETLKTLCDVVDNWFEFGPRVVSRLTTDRVESFTAEEVRQIASDVARDGVRRAVYGASRVVEDARQHMARTSVWANRQVRHGLDRPFDVFIDLTARESAGRKGIRVGWPHPDRFTLNSREVTCVVRPGTWPRIRITSRPGLGAWFPQSPRSAR